jgi:mono/diheme cytochrome c family protein
MSTVKFITALAVTAALGVLPAGAMEFGNPAQGLEYARSVCAECHAVERSIARSPNPNAPSFVAISETRGMTAMAIRTWLQSPHRSMPNILVKTEDRDNLIAYILGLKPK